MIKSEENKGTQHIVYSCYSKISRAGEQFVPDHLFTYVLSGSSDLYINGKNHHFKEGDFRFLRRSQLAKFVKYPSVSGEYRAITIILDQGILRSMSAEHNLSVYQEYRGENALLLQPNALFTNYIASLTPYLDGKNHINSILTTIKVKEAIMVLLESNPELKNVLFDFSKPGKIELEAYMNEHYKFNIDISHFAYLTGRSLATFKRDFSRIYKMTPNRWIQQQRLKDAYYLIKEKSFKASDVYLEVGFKDLSHFSFAFKKAYGFAPTQI